MLNLAYRGIYEDRYPIRDGRYIPILKALSSVYRRKILVGPGYLPHTGSGGTYLFIVLQPLLHPDKKDIPAIGDHIVIWLDIVEHSAPSVFKVIHVESTALQRSYIIKGTFITS